MTVKELIDVLKEYPEDHQVILAKDREGNGFSPWAEIGGNHYVPYNTWSGDIDGDSEQENAIVLWPTN